MADRTNAVDRLIGSRIAERRRALGLSVGELARRADLPSDQLEAQEAGRLRVPAEALRRLARALGASPRDFLPQSPDELSLKRD